MDWIGTYKHWPAALVASVGVVMSLVLFDHARSAATDRMSAEFSIQAQTRARDLQEVLSRYEGTIEGFAAAFPYQNVDADQFRAYAKNVYLASSVLRSGLENLSWAPRVLDRDRFEAAKREAGNPNFAIQDKRPGAGLETAPRRPDYYPIVYVEPQHADALIGLDLTRLSALEKAIATGTMTATATMHLLHSPDASLLFLPVYPTAAKGAAGGPPVGILTFRMSISAAIDAIIGSFEPLAHGVELYVIDDAAPRGQRLIYDHAAAASHAPIGEANEAKTLVEPYWGSSFTFAGRDYTIIMQATPRLLAARLAGAGWFELATGLLLTALLALYLISSRQRADRLRQLAATLQREVAVRRSAEEDLRLAQWAMDHSSEAICLIDPAGRYLNVNDAFCKQVGLYPRRNPDLDRVRHCDSG